MIVAEIVVTESIAGIDRDHCCSAVHLFLYLSQGLVGRLINKVINKESEYHA